jgi:hypothetical protein
MGLASFGIESSPWDAHVAGAIIAANGGDSGKFDQAGQAGCGGAGRIAILYNSSGSYTNHWL